MTLSSEESIGKKKGEDNEKSKGSTFYNCTFILFKTNEEGLKKQFWFANRKYDNFIFHPLFFNSIHLLIQKKYQ